ncbi:MAG TPA: type I methionyl aminopeptidase [Burkholderiales bacterium]|nr:type I methionyl aminopeptidase [Burkholderiales bacterium]
MANVRIKSGARQTSGQTRLSCDFITENGGPSSEWATRARRRILDYNPLSLKNRLCHFPAAAARSVRHSSMAVSIKTPDEIEKMRVAGRLAAEVLDFIDPHVTAGTTTGELDRLCHDYIARVQQAIPAPLNYAPPGYQPFPRSICTSVNHVVCHGVPGDKQLRSGDIVNIDITVIKDGYHGDTSRMFYVGRPSIQARRLCEVTFECMCRGIESVRPGAHLGDIGHAIQGHAEGHGYSVVREFCGHGIGRKFHEEPQVLHYGRPGVGLKLGPGMTFTIEPMINAGKPDIRQLADGWTVVTKDHSLSAQWEHTVLVTGSGYEVLTVSNGAPPMPALQTREHG